MPDAKKDLTWGQDVAGVAFNPSNDPKVAQSKQRYADLLDEHHNAVADLESQDGSDLDETRRDMAIHFHEMAIDNLIITQMLSTKATTYKV
jgi:hypothetical protein